MPAKSGKAKADAGKYQRPKQANPKRQRKAIRPTVAAVKPLYHTFDQPKPAGAYFDEPAATHAVEWIEGLRHFKGRWAGRRFLLMEWQRELVRQLFGQKRADGTRLYRIAYVEAPRKSGKTTLAAAIALYLAHGDDEAAPEVFFAAYDKDQARVCYDTARFMVEQDPELHARSVIYNSKREMLLRENPGGFLRCLSKDSAKQYGLNMHGLIFDELMTQKSREMWNALTTSQGSREQPLTFCITTAGWDQLSVCFEQHEAVRNIAEGNTRDESFLGVVYGAAMDADWTDEEVWKRANPSLGETASLDFYREKFTKAKNQATEQNAFRTLLLSQWVGQAERFLDMEAWDACAVEKVKDGPQAFAGLDLSATTDLTAFVVVSGNGKPEQIHAYCFLPAEGIEERERRDRVPYRVWAEQGYLTLTPGATVDYDYVRSAILGLGGRFNLRGRGAGDISFDKWNAIQLVKELEDEGLEMFIVPQTINGLSAPTKELLRLVMDNRIHHDGNPLLRWCASNVAPRMDSSGNVKPDKERSAHRIDPIVALIMALDGWSRRGRKSVSIYENRELTAV